jgi:hypothetical protein
MAAIMKNMELKKVDQLKPDALMPGDIISYDERIVEVISISEDAYANFYFVEYKDDFGEKDVAEFHYAELIDWYVYVD